MSDKTEEDSALIERELAKVTAERDELRAKVATLERQKLLNHTA